MNRKLKKIALFLNKKKTGWLDKTKTLIGQLERFDAEILLPAEFSDCFVQKRNIEFGELDDIFAGSDIVIAVGGDGTFLRAVQYAVRHDVPVLGVNIGNLGYLSELEFDSVEENIGKIFDEKFDIENRILLDVMVNRQGEEQILRTVLNECYITKCNSGNMSHISLSSEDGFIGSYWGDGIIVSTPTGSTAYSLSAGGPVLDPRADNIVITPVAAHMLHARPMVMMTDRTLSLCVNEKSVLSAAVVCDGVEVAEIRGSDTVEIRRSLKNLKLVRIKNRGFYEILRKKLNERWD